VIRQIRQHKFGKSNTNSANRVHYLFTFLHEPVANWLRRRLFNRLFIAITLHFASVAHLWRICGASEVRMWFKISPAFWLSFCYSFVCGERYGLVFFAKVHFATR